MHTRPEERISFAHEDMARRGLAHLEQEKRFGLEVSEFGEASRRDEGEQC